MAGQQGEQAHACSDVVILGGGFAGLSAAKALRRAPVRITLIDRRNHHLFQPLLYQVATAALSPGDIAAPIRHILRAQQNLRAVLMAEAKDIDLARRVVHLGDEGRDVAYDYLIVATGVSSSYFGHDEWREFAPPLKTIEDALEIRRRFLIAFEQAEREDDERSRQARLTFVIVGGGPTGVEMAGTMAEIAHRAIPRDFRVIDTRTARIILVEGSQRLLGGFHPDLGERAKRDLERLGVEVRTGVVATEVDAGGVKVGGERIEAHNIIWAAGVQASGPVAALSDRADGRVSVRPDLSLPSHAEVFVVGDAAHVVEPGGAEVPGMAPGAMQMGRYAAGVIAREAAAGRRGAAPPKREPFRFRDKGKMATIGRARAVVDLRGVRAGGLIAWLLWCFVHIYFLIGFRRRLLVLIQWAWAYVRFERGARLITGETRRG